ncbi:hypothetical protein MSG28_004306 [Choristoneura fumiferana]|uniref:Uncharacterized protein n=2 Tax=Choristoneura fumiferana TaxID=7141 RepID=A0ACC0KIM2_CHOFU|nr:hypothetical protein MSG28_004306 [Choristoneura fumiferana]KAI8436259.1 hypothetical protein MSG28_004306 [Choristoneura fumiferana]
MGILEKISEIEKEIARTQKNKATEYHLGLLKAKLAKYRSQLLEPSKKGGDKGEGFDVLKSGDARVALIGFPSVGKSTLLSTLTHTHSEAASYEFTTLTCIPGQKKGGGLSFNSTCQLTKVDEKLVQMILHEYKIFNAEGVTIEHVCHSIHRTLAAQLKYALVWGTSTKYSPQRVGIGHSVADEDVVQLIKK